MDFTIHQYLLVSDPAIPFAMGTVPQAEPILPQVEEVSKEKTLKYILVSHMESDECGGLFMFLKRYPNVKFLFSSLCAGELPGFGYTGTILAALAANEKETLRDGGLE